MHNTRGEVTILLLKVLNVVNQYDACEMELVKQHKVFTSLGDLPSSKNVYVVGLAATEEWKNSR